MKFASYKLHVGITQQFTRRYVYSTVGTRCHTITVDITTTTATAMATTSVLALWLAL